MKKKILFFIPNLAHGGAERVLVNLVNHIDLTKFDVTVQTMFDVGIYTAALNKNIRYIGGLKHYFRGNTHLFKLLTPKQLYKMYIKEHYDVIVSYLEGPSARVVSGCDDKNTKLVCWIHVEQHNYKYAASCFRNVAEAKKCYNRFDRIICVADTVRKDFVSLFKTKSQPEVLYNTVESDVIREKMAEPIDDIEFSKDEINICSVAKLMYVKGYDRLVNILKLLREKNIPAHIYIVGKGEEKTTLEAQIKKYGLEDCWTFVGFKENPYKYVRASDLYVCSSRREGFSTAVTESLIIGTPVVSTDCSGAKELLGYNNEYGIVTENNQEALLDGILTMLKTPETLEFYRQKANERGKMFQTKATVSEVEKMLLEVSK